MKNFASHPKSRPSTSKSGLSNKEYNEKYSWLSFFIISLCPILSAQQNQLERVDAADFFDLNAGSIVYIEIADSQVLVFNDQDNSKYVLHGRPLEIHAKTIETTGNVVVRSFSENEHGPDTPGVPPTQPQAPDKPQGPGSGDNGQKGDNGAQGATGATGQPGDPSAMFRLYISAATGSGSITFNSAGMKGGPGQEGGKGQNGQRGGRGHDRSSSDSPGDGGNGGDGGIGGQGGQGGTGGAGGDIVFDTQMCLLTAVRLLSPESNGGDPGTSGGMPGGHGEGGSGFGTFGNTDSGHAGTSDGTPRQNELAPAAWMGSMVHPEK